MIKSLEAFINKGTDYSPLEDEKIRIRQVNLLNSLIILMVSVLSVYVYLLDDISWMLVFVVPPVMAGLIYFNQHGRYHLARVGSLLTVMVSIYVVIYLAETQIPAAFGHIIIAYTGYYLMTKKGLKVTIAVLALLSYFITQYYNLKYRPFDDLQYFTVIAFLIFSYVAIFFIDSERERHTQTIEEQKRKLEEKNREILAKNEELAAAREKEVALLREKLELQNRELSLQAIKEVERNKLLEGIKSKIDAVEDLEGKLKPTRQLIKNALNSDQSWDGFIQKFEAVYPSYFDKLKTQFGSMTINEMKLCGYIKVGMSNHEIERVTHTASSTVKKNLNRLKKKLLLEADDSLRDFLRNFPTQP